MSYAPPSDYRPQAPGRVAPYLRSLKDGRIYPYTPVLAARADMHPWYDAPPKVEPRVAPIEPSRPEFMAKPADAPTEADFRRAMAQAQASEPTPEEIFARMDGNQGGKHGGPAGNGYTPPTVFAPKPEDAMTEAEFQARLARETAPETRVETPVISRTATPIAGTPDGTKAARKGKATRKKAAGDLPPTEFDQLGSAAPRFDPNQLPLDLVNPEYGADDGASLGVFDDATV